MNSLKLKLKNREDKTINKVKNAFKKMHNVYF